jgi:hypothetical protein
MDKKNIFKLYSKVARKPKDESKTYKAISQMYKKVYAARKNWVLAYLHTN